MADIACNQIKFVALELLAQKVIGDNGAIGFKVISPFLSGVVLSFTVKVVVAEEASLEIMLCVDCDGGRFWGLVFRVCFDRAGFSGPTLGGLLLSDEERLRSSWDSTAVLLWPSPLDGGSGSEWLYSFASHSSSVLHPLQQSLQSTTRNLKQNASIFMHGWKHMHRFLKSILFLSECARSKLRWQVMANKR